jgi:hypothetical protein
MTLDIDIVTVTLGAFGATCTIFFAVLGWLFKTKYTEIKTKSDNTDQSLHDFKVYCAETFITKEQVKDLKEDIERHIDKIDQNSIKSRDKIIDRIDKMAEKFNERHRNDNQ